MREVCPVCHCAMGGVGLLRRDILPGDRRFGTIGEAGEDVHYVHCHHSPEVVLRAYLEFSGLLESDAAQAPWPTPERAPVIAAVDAACGAGAGLLALYGGFGTGKTFFLRYLVNGFVRSLKRGAYRTAAGMLDELRSSYKSESFDSVFDRYLSIPVLAVDELDKFQATDWAADKLFQLFDYRYMRHRSLLTVVAYNDPANVPEYILSRLGQFRIVEVTGPDLRPLVQDAVQY